MPSQPHVHESCLEGAPRCPSLASVLPTDQVCFVSPTVIRHQMKELLPPAVPSEAQGMQRGRGWPYSSAPRATLGLCTLSTVDSSVNTSQGHPTVHPSQIGGIIHLPQAGSPGQHCFLRAGDCCGVAQITHSRSIQPHWA